ncbi:MAG: MBL fold metallo-hydrolase [Planctomycetes bacterium]|nr:MBL fold metallo-hydrolase [Planctomycetota bacterium]
MYGNCPRAVWSKWSPPDEEGRIALACRTLLVETGGRRILFETGIGAFFPPAMRERFGVVESEHVLLGNLVAAGAPHDAIDAVVLSHLHFDHAGGLLSAWREDEESELLFPNARFVVGAEAWRRANDPHPRDRASFIPELQPLLEASGRLEIVDGATSDVLGNGFRFHVSNGHTPGLLCTEIDAPAGPVVFAADLIPGAPWMHLPITMGYDRYPELLIDEKRQLLEDLERRGGYVFFTHDPDVALGKVRRDAKGRFRADAA